MSQAKLELSPLETLSKDMATYISMVLDKTDEPQQAKTSRRHFSIFRAPEIQTNRILALLDQDFAQGYSKHIAKLAEINPKYRQRVLFLLAGLGAQDEMQAILQKHPEELLVSRELRDISGAVFPSITLFQHCLWTKDLRYMANMMLDCLPKTQEGEAIRLALVEQYQVHQSHGVTYTLNGEKHEGERHFNLQPLITAITTYQIGFNNWSHREKERYWCHNVGMAQRALPAHIRHHYCDWDQVFSGTADLEKPKLNRSLQIFNGDTGRYMLWSCSLVGLGQDFAVYPWRLHGFTATGKSSGLGLYETLAALRHLDFTRTEIDLPALKKRLDTPMRLGNDCGLKGP